jgi:MtN3 and saliva related transmembrane protein
VNLAAQLFNLFLHGIRQAEGVGYAAAACTTLSFIPQIIKIRKQGGDDLSYGMLGMYAVGLTLWLVYGLIVYSGPVVIANFVSVVLVAYAIVLKATMGKPRLGPS